MNLSYLTSTGEKPWLTINANSIDCTLGTGVSTGIVNFENLPLALSPLPDHTILFTDSTDLGRPTINNGTDVFKLAYTDEIPVSAQLSSEIIFRQGAISAGNVFGTWDEVADLISEKEGALIVFVDDSIVSPCVVSSSVDCKGKTIFIGAFGNPIPKLEISGGFALTDPKSFVSLELLLSSPVLPNLIFSDGSVLQFIQGLRLTIVDATVPNISIADGESFVLVSDKGVQINNSGNTVIKLGVGSSLVFVVFENTTAMTINDLIESVDNSSNLVLVYDSSFDSNSFTNAGFTGTYINSPICNSISVKYDDATLPQFGSDNVQGVLDIIKQNLSLIGFGPSLLSFSLPIQVPSNQDSNNPDIQWADSANTGLYSSSTGAIDISCANTNVAHFDISDTILSNNVKVNNLEVNNNYSLPTNAPTNGQFMGVTGGNVSWISAFNGFQAQYTGGVLSVVGSIQNICNTLVLGSNYNTGTYTYTVPLTGIYELNYNVCWIWTSTVNPASGRLDSAFKIVDGGTTFPGYKINQIYAAATIAETFRGINSMTLYSQLNAGATIQLTLSNISSANNMVIDTAHLSARLIQGT